MRIRRARAVGVLAQMLAVACGGSDGNEAGRDQDAPSETAPTTDATAGDDTIDRTRLPVGDDRVSATEPGVGILCTTMPGGGGGASTQGPWFSGVSEVGAGISLRGRRRSGRWWW